jgi:hypothetical protein
MLFWCVMLFCGCGQSAKWPEQTAAPQPTTQPTTPVQEKYNEYLLIMNDSQRARFFKLESVAERDRFIEAEGIQQKKYLDDHLRVGMAPEKIEEILGRPLVNEVEMGTQRQKMQWVYRVFNGYRNIQYLVWFKNNKVTEWKVWPS